MKGVPVNIASVKDNPQPSAFDICITPSAELYSKFISSVVNLCCKIPTLQISGSQRYSITAFKSVPCSNTASVFNVS